MGIKTKNCLLAHRDVVFAYRRKNSGIKARGYYCYILRNSSESVFPIRRPGENSFPVTSHSDVYKRQNIDRDKQEKTEAESKDRHG